MAISVIGGGAAAPVGVAAPFGTAALVAGFASSNYSFTARPFARYYLFSTSTPGGQSCSWNAPTTIASGMVDNTGTALTSGQALVAIPPAIYFTAEPKSYTFGYNNTAVTIFTPWAESATPNSTANKVIRYLNGLFLMGSGSAIFTSTDLITWTQRLTGAVSTISDFAWNGTNLYMAQANSGHVYTSADAITWTLRGSNASTASCATTFGAGLFVTAVNTGGAGSTGYYTSTDGVTWTGRTATTTTLRYSIAFGNSIFVGVGGNSVIESSPDGITWTSRLNLGAGAFQGVAYLNGKFWVWGYNGTVPTVYSSTNGTTWTLLTNPAGFVASGSLPPLGMAYGNSTLSIVSPTGRVFTSTDNGTTWTGQRTVFVSGGTGQATGTYNNLIFSDKFVTYSANFIITSPDSITGSTGNFAVFTTAAGTIN
jgi:hypothetical protein